MRNKKFLFALLAVVLVVACSVGVLMFGASAEVTREPVTYTVGTEEGNYPSVQAALAAAAETDWFDKAYALTIDATAADREEVAVTDEILFGIPTIFDTEGRLPITISGGTLTLKEGATGNVVCSNSYTFKDMNFYIADEEVNFYAGSGEVVLDHVTLSDNNGQALAKFYADCPTAAAFEGWTAPNGKIHTSLEFKGTNYDWATVDNLGAIGATKDYEGDITAGMTEAELIVTDSHLKGIRLRNSDAQSPVSKLSLTINGKDTVITSIGSANGDNGGSIIGEAFPDFDIQITINDGTISGTSEIVEDVDSGIKNLKIDINGGKIGTLIANYEAFCAENATLTVKDGEHTSIYGVYTSATSTANVENIISGGTITNFYGGRLSGKNINTMTGGTVGTFSGCYNSDGAGGTEAYAENNISGGTITTFYGAGRAKTTVASVKMGLGTVVNNISQSAEIATFYGAGLTKSSAAVGRIENNISGGTIGTFRGSAHYTGTASLTAVPVTELVNNISGGTIDAFYGTGFATLPTKVENTVSETAEITDFYGVCDYSAYSNNDAFVDIKLTNKVTGGTITNFYGTQATTSTAHVKEVTNVIEDGTIGIFKGTGDITATHTVAYGGNEGDKEGANKAAPLGYWLSIYNTVTGGTFNAYYGTGDLDPNGKTGEDVYYDIQPVWNEVSGATIMGDYYGTGFASADEVFRVEFVFNKIGEGTKIYGDFNASEAWTNGTPHKSLSALYSGKIHNEVTGGEICGAFYGSSATRTISGSVYNAISGGILNSSLDYADAGFIGARNCAGTVTNVISGGTFCKDFIATYTVGSKYTVTNNISGGTFSTYNGMRCKDAYGNDQYTNLTFGSADKEIVAVNGSSQYSLGVTFKAYDVGTVLNAGDVYYESNEEGAEAITVADGKTVEVTEALPLYYSSEDFRDLEKNPILVSEEDLYAKVLATGEKATVSAATYLGAQNSSRPVNNTITGGTFKVLYCGRNGSNSTITNTFGDAENATTISASTIYGGQASTSVTNTIQNTTLTVSDCFYGGGVKGGEGDITNTVTDSTFNGTWRGSSASGTDQNVTNTWTNSTNPKESSTNNWWDGNNGAKCTSLTNTLTDCTLGFFRGAEGADPGKVTNQFTNCHFTASLWATHNNVTGAVSTTIDSCEFDASVYGSNGSFGSNQVTIKGDTVVHGAVYAANSASRKVNLTIEGGTFYGAISANDETPDATAPQVILAGNIAIGSESVVHISSVTPSEDGSLRIITMMAGDNSWNNDDKLAATSASSGSAKVYVKYTVKFLGTDYQADMANVRYRTLGSTEPENYPVVEDRYIKAGASPITEVYTSMAVEERIYINLLLKKADVDAFLGLMVNAEGESALDYEAVIDFDENGANGELGTGSFTADSAVEKIGDVEYYKVRVGAVAADNFGKNITLQGANGFGFTANTTIFDICETGLSGNYNEVYLDLFTAIYNYGASVVEGKDMKPMANDFVETGAAAPVAQIGDTTVVEFTGMNLLMGDAMGISFKGTLLADDLPEFTMTVKVGDKVEEDVPFRVYSDEKGNVWINVYVNAENANDEITFIITANGENILGVKTSLKGYTETVMNDEPASLACAQLIQAVVNVQAAENV